MDRKGEFGGTVIMIGDEVYVVPPGMEITTEMLEEMMRDALNRPFRNQPFLASPFLHASDRPIGIPGFDGMPAELKLALMLAGVEPHGFDMYPPLRPFEIHAPHDPGLAAAFAELTRDGMPGWPTADDGLLDWLREPLTEAEPEKPSTTWEGWVGFIIVLAFIFLRARRESSEQR